MTDAAASTIAKGSGVSASIKDTIVGIVPSDVVNPFLKANMLQIIFIAAMLGIAVGRIADKLHCFKDLLADCNLVCSKITSIIIGFMPLAIFCSMAKMILSMELQTLASTLALAVFVLSIGAPGVPGVALVCISLLVPLIGVPAEAISIIMGLYSIVGMMHTCVNVTGDTAVTLITARSEDLVDLKTFNS